MTYRNCKKLIEAAVRRNEKTASFIADMEIKLEVFKRNSRISESEYNELINMLH